MVDASLRVSIVHPFKTLRDELGMSIVYITHDLATAYYIGDNIIIMQKGQVVEGGEARTVLDNPRHPYSKLLKSAVLERGEWERSKAARERQDMTVDHPYTQGVPGCGPVRAGCRRDD